MKVLELRGYKALRAWQAFHTLMLGLKMLPAYLGETYEEFYDRVDSMPPADQEKLIREAVHFVELSEPEVDALICFTTDKNGVPYSSVNVKNLNPAQLVECIVAVCVEISKIKVDLVSEHEKKNLAPEASAST